MTQDQEWFPRQQFYRKDMQFIMDYKGNMSQHCKKTNICTRASPQRYSLANTEFVCCKAHVNAFVNCTFNLYESLWKKYIFLTFWITAHKMKVVHTCKTCGLFSGSCSINVFIHKLSLKTNAIDDALKIVKCSPVDFHRWLNLHSCIF